MTTGLLIKDSSGRVIMDPDTFTVRMVAMFNYYGGRLSFGSSRTISVPAARAGMFVQLSPLWQIPSGENLLHDENDIDFGVRADRYERSPYKSGVPRGDHLKCMPSASVSDGRIVIRASAWSGWASSSTTWVRADVAVYLMVNI